MRILGYIFLIVGFFWLVECQFSVRPKARAIVVRHLEKLAPNQTFTREQVQDGVHDSVFELVDAVPWFILPGTMMLCGAILLDRARRNGRNSRA